MIVRQNLEEVRPAERAVALGTFDGVHRGHRDVIEGAVAAAREAGLRSAIATFHPHPARILRPEQAPPQLSSLSRRAALVSELEPDEFVLVRFTQAFSSLDPRAFAEHVLGERLGARHVVVGENFRYGHQAAGTPERLAADGAELGFTVKAVPLRQLDGAPVSSSRIRERIAAGDVEAAARLLGRPPWVEGAIVRGDGRGRALGFATANLAPAPWSVLPARGVYAGVARLPGLVRPAAISVGYNPTFSDDRRAVRVEAHLLDFDDDIYGSPLRLELSARLRDEERYESVDELVAQVQRDIEDVRLRVPVGA